MAARRCDEDRFHELLSCRAIERLSAAEQEELDALTLQHPDLDADALDRVAAFLALSALDVEPMPAVLRDRLEADAQAWLAARRRFQNPSA